MSVNWRDYVSVVAIVLLIGAIIISLTNWLGVTVQDWRPMTILTLLLGMVVFAIIGPEAIPMRGPVSGFVARFGLLIVILGILGVLVNSQLLFVLLGLSLVLLWSFVTFYHMRIQT